MTSYNKIANAAAEMYQEARNGNALALAVENIMCDLSDERCAGRIDSEDDAAVNDRVAFLADGYGFTLSDILNAA